MKNKLVVSVLWVLFTVICIVVCNIFFNKSIVTAKQIGVMNGFFSPKIVPISLTKGNTAVKQISFLVVENDKIVLYDPNTSQMQNIPSGSLTGKFQNILEYKNNQFLKLKLIKTIEEEKCGIEIYDITKNKWISIPVSVIARKEAKDLPHFAIIYHDKKAYCLIWSGVNYTSNKPQNTLEVIDLDNNKLIMQKNINFKGGKIVQEDNNSYLLIGSTPLSQNERLDDLDIGGAIIRHVGFSNNDPELVNYFRLKPKQLSSSQDGFSTLAIDKKNNIFAEIIWANDIHPEFETNQISIPQNLQNDKLINAISLITKVVLVFESEDNIQKIVLYSDNKFKNLTNIDSDFDLSHAAYFASNNEGFYLVFIQDEKIMQMRIRK